MPESKPRKAGERLGDLSPGLEWIWMGQPRGWIPSDEPAFLAKRSLDDLDE